MNKAELLTLFQCLVPLTWVLFLPAFAFALIVPDARRVPFLLLLSLAAAALAVVTLDAARAGVWG